jgi:signal transduction histidine kinase
VIGGTGLVVLHADRSLDRASAGARALLGADDGDGEAVRAFVADRLGAEGAAALAAGEVEVIERTEQVVVGGAPRWLRVAVALVGDESEGRRFVAQIDDVSSLHHAGAELDRLRAMESLVTAMSTRFIDIDADDLRPAVYDALSRLGELFGVDRVYVIRFDDANTATVLDEVWWRDGIERISNQILDLPRGAQRWWLRQLRAGEPVAVRSLADLPEEAADAVAALAAEGVASLLFVPLLSRGRVTGFLGMEARRHERPWAPDEVRLMRTVGEAIVNAMDRLRAEAALADAADELAQRNEDLLRSNRDLETFADRAAHDLRAPLARIEMALHHLADAPDVDLGPSGRPLVDISLRAADRMRHLIDDLLTYARSGPPAMRTAPVDLAEVARQALADLGPLADGAAVTIGALPTVEGHESLLGQLLQNLLANALKFRRDSVRPEVAVAAVRNGDEWEVSVTDNGIGIPAEQRDSVFAMFTRLHGVDDFPGSGIGLATCQKVVANHGGRIWVEEAATGGCRFVFTLPATA